jgi:single-strand DNA-binding protein
MVFPKARCHPQIGFAGGLMGCESGIVMWVADTDQTGADMTSEPLVTMAGWVAGTPVIREIRGGHVVCNFTLASTPKRFDPTSKAWKDLETLFLRISCWRQLATNVGACVHKGDPVVVHGKFSIRRYEKDGTERFSNEIEAYHVGFNLQFGRATFAKNASFIMPPAAISEVDLMPEAA